MRTVAIDVSACYAPMGGIRRYCSSIIARFDAGLKPVGITNLAFKTFGVPGWDGNFATHLARSNRYPVLGAISRLASTFVANSFRAQCYNPNVYWGPAHRLPFKLPRTTNAVVTVHDMCWRVAPHTMRVGARALDAASLNSAIGRCERVLTVSKSTAGEIIAQWPWIESKLRVTPLAASLPQGSAVYPDAFGLGQHGYFLFVGTLEPRKNLVRLVQAYTLAGQGDALWPDLVICGGRGWGSMALQAECRRLGIVDKVRFLLPSDQVLATLYRHAICLVLPSIYEGFGLPLIEAITQGRPVLTSNLASMPEVAGRAGLLVNPISVASIAEGLRVMAKDSAVRESLAANAVNQARSFSWDKTTLDTAQVLTEAAG